MKNHSDILLLTSFILISIYIFISLKKHRLFLIVAPFLVVGLFVISSIGIFDIHSFLDSDLSIHKSLIDMLINNNLFCNDRVMQALFKIYPHGYHYILLPFYRLGIPMPLLSKMLGVIFSFITPLLFYYLGSAIYKRRDLAFLSGIFAYMPTVWHTIYSGLPRSIGFIFSLLAIAFLFKYRNTKRLIYIITDYLIISLLILVHPFSALVLFIFTCLFLIFELIFTEKLEQSYKFIKAIVLLFIIAPFLIFYLNGQRQFLEFTNRGFLVQSGLFSRVPYAIQKIKIIQSIGLFPILLFAYVSVDLLFKKIKIGENIKLLYLINISFSLFFLAILSFDKLYFLKAHRFPPFISCFFYLFCIPQIKEIYIVLKSKILIIFAIFLTLLPPFNYIISRRNILCPYQMHRLDPSIRPKPDPIQFDELYRIAVKVKETVEEAELIACPLRFGDTLRMYSQRGVSSSWKIGGFMNTYYRAALIYEEQILNSDLLYTDPLSLHNRLKVKYFLLEKNKIGQITDILAKLNLIFETENLLLYKYNANF